MPQKLRVRKFPTKMISLSLSPSSFLPFRCTFQQYGHIMATVCKPVPMPYTKRCKADFECGYNEGIGSWDKCYKGGCQRIIVD